MRTLIVLLSAIAVLSIVAQSADSATLGFQTSTEGDEHGQVAIPVYLDVDNNESVASLQCDLRFESASMRYLDSRVGEAAEHADKSIHANLVKEDCLRIIVAGLNRTAIAPGPVVWLHFEAYGPIVVSTLHMDTAILSDPQGNAVPVVLTPNSLELDRTDGVPHASNTFGSAVPPTSNGAKGNYFGLAVAILGVGTAMLWARRRPGKRRRS